MSLLTATRTASAEADLRLAATREGRAQYRLRGIKLLCLFLLAICFWFSVPYSLSHVETTDHAEAAAIEAAAYAGNASRQMAMPVMAVICLFMLWRLPRLGRFRSPLLWVCCAYFAWAAASIVWSDDPSITGKRLVVFAIDALVCATLASRLSVSELTGFGFCATTVVTIISFFIDALVSKTLAPGDPDYRFAGVMTPNFQAMNIIASMVCAMTMSLKRPRWLVWVGPMVFVELGLLYLTRARVGTILSLLLVIIFAVRFVRTQLRPQARAILIAAVLAVVIPALIFISGNSGAGAAQSAFMLGRNDSEATSSLSNRAPLWAELSDSVAQRPWLGFGYAGFWSPVRVERISLDQGWTVPNAHNTFLDQTLSLGFPGAAIYVLLVLGACITAWRRNNRERTPESLFIACLLLWLVLDSFTEAMPLDPFLPTLLAYTAIGKTLLEFNPVEADEREVTASELTLEGAR